VAIGNRPFSTHDVQGCGCDEFELTPGKLPRHHIIVLIENAYGNELPIFRFNLIVERLRIGHLVHRLENRPITAIDGILGFVDPAQGVLRREFIGSFGAGCGPGNCARNDTELLLSSC